MVPGSSWFVEAGGYAVGAHVGSPRFVPDLSALASAPLVGRGLPVILACVAVGELYPVFRSRPFPRPRLPLQ